MLKKVVSLVLVLSLVLGTTLSVNAMYVNETYEETGEFLKAIGLIKGDAEGNLNSMDTITREESIIVILRMLELEKEAMETKDGEKSFNDIPNGSYFAPYIAFAKEKGITNGVGGGAFGYGKDVTVKELLTMFLRAAGYSADWATENIWEKSVKYGLTKKLDKSDNDAALRGDAFIIFDNAIRLPYNPKVKPRTCLLNTLITKIHVLGENPELFEKYPMLNDYVAQKYTPDYSFLDEMSLVKEEKTGHYDVMYQENAPKIDGKLDDEAWKKVDWISSSFKYPWEEKEASLTEFKACHDKTNFYFSFKVVDEEVVKEEDWKADESTVDIEDRVELFFASTSVDKPVDYKLVPYYATEVDPLGRAHDYSVVYYRNFDSKFNIEKAEYAAEITDDGYMVEGMIPMESFEELGLINSDKTMRVGLFRAEFSKVKDKDELMMQWISWIDPKTPIPDFHVDSAFGEFKFMEME